jgi:hypothetical protein
MALKTMVIAILLAAFGLINYKYTLTMAIKLLSNKIIPSMISIKERIFQIETYDGDIVLCNVGTAQELIKEDLCKRIKHYWNHKFSTIGKREVLDMPL